MYKNNTPTVSGILSAARRLRGQKKKKTEEFSPRRPRIVCSGTSVSGRRRYLPYLRNPIKLRSRFNRKNGYTAANKTATGGGGRSRTDGQVGRGRNILLYYYTRTRDLWRPFRKETPRPERRCFDPSCAAGLTRRTSKHAGPQNTPGPSIIYYSFTPFFFYFFHSLFFLLRIYSRYRQRSNDRPHVVVPTCVRVGFDCEYQNLDDRRKLRTLLTVCAVSLNIHAEHEILNVLKCIYYNDFVNDAGSQDFLSLWATDLQGGPVTQRESPLPIGRLQLRIHKKKKKKCS